jgi:hypothetical protein
MIVSILGLPEGLGFELRGRALKPADSYRSGKALRNLKIESLFTRVPGELELTDHEGQCYVYDEDEGLGRFESYSKRRHTASKSQLNGCSRSHERKDGFNTYDCKPLQKPSVFIPGEFASFSSLDLGKMAFNTKLLQDLCMV